MKIRLKGMLPWFCGPVQRRQVHNARYSDQAAEINLIDFSISFMNHLATGPVTPCAATPEFI